MRMSLSSRHVFLATLICFSDLVHGKYFEDSWVDPDPFKEESIEVKGCSKDEHCQNDKYCNGSDGCLVNASCKYEYCECPKGRYGWRCQYATCNDFSFCFNGGDCVVVENVHECFCPGDTGGPRCEEKFCSEDYNCHGTCNQNGVCQVAAALENSRDSNGAITPDCTKFDPCQNGGSCSVESGEYKCKCKDNFRGPRCRQGDCDTNWCINGICYENQCVCYPGYSGDSCEHITCQSYHGCYNGGQCTINNDTIKCNCNEKKYGGLYCEYECSPECPQNSKCGLDGQCYCEVGFEGEQCTQSLPFVLNQMSRIYFAASGVTCLVMIFLYHKFSKDIKEPFDVPFMEYE